MESSSPTPQPPAKLERIGRYRIVRPLSKGGMALVYEGRRESLAGVSPRVAIKVILPEFGDSDAFNELFINEARLGASMHHQNLVQIQDFDREGDRFFLVMEYVEGLTLRQAISLCRRHGVRVPLGVVAEVGRQACDGLHYAHAATDEQGKALRLVHRDVKPSNLILSPHGVVKLLDFGISKGALVREKKGAVKGTWGYMAPEQAFGKEVGPVADVFGLATVLWELASTKVLFEGQDKTHIKRLLMDDHAARMAATLDHGQYGPLIPVLVRALQRDPKARYENAADFGRALSLLLPDPITARDEVVAFYRTARALQEGLPVEIATREMRGDLPASQGSIVASPSGATTTGADPSAPLWIIGAVAAFAFALVLIFATILVVQSRWERPGDVVSAEPRMTEVVGVADPVEPAPVDLAADEPPGPAGEGAPGEEEPPPAASRTATDGRPPPQSTVALPGPTTRRAPEPAAPIVVIRKKDETSTTSSAPVAVEPGYLTLGAPQAGSTREADAYLDGRYVRRLPIKRLEVEPGPHTLTFAAADGRQHTFEVVVESGVETRHVWDFDRNEWKPR